MGKHIFLSKVLQMSASFLIFNISGICYNIFISSKMGAEGTGLFHLIMNVYSLGISLAISGMGLSCSRLLSDRPLKEGLSMAGSIISKCMKLCLVTSLLAFSLLFSLSDFIATRIIGNSKCAVGIKILAPSVIFCAISAVISGYFNAFAKIGAYCVGQTLGEAFSWVSALFLINCFPKKDFYVFICLSVSLSAFIRAISDIIFFYSYSQKSMSCKERLCYGDLVHLCVPIALGSYLRTGLTATENLLIPIRLESAGGHSPLGIYGTIKGMAMPLALFPGVFINAFTSLLVPEIARRRSEGKLKSLRHASSLSIIYTLNFAFLTGGILLFYGKDIAGVFFDSENCAHYLRLLCVLPVFLFTDSVCDAILKGMDDQVFSLKLNVVDSILRNLMIFFLIPVFGGYGYIIMLYISEIFNFSLSLRRLKRKTALPAFTVKAATLQLICVGMSHMAVKLLPFKNSFSKALIFTGLYIALSEIFLKNLKKEICDRCR